MYPRALLPCVVIGLVLPLALPTLPDAAWWVVLLVLGVVAGSLRRWLPATLLAGMAWTGVHLQEAGALRTQFATPQQIAMTGTVADRPVVRDGMLEFSLVPDASALDARLRNPSVRVRWYRDFPKVSQGQRWQLELSLKPARSRLNFTGADPERGYFARDVAALTTVRSGILLEHATEGAEIRSGLAERLEQALDDHPASGIVMALAMAERSGLAHDDWARFRLTGTSHLFAISGLHVGLAASLGFLFGKAALWVLPVRGLLRAGLVLPWLSGLAT
ncbi:MAG: DUF4131 domain-containing protein, partial [Xanthomonadales bacterium]|nr:DUF4131 domain-containing protein [Xanthomonadales bacterium]